MIQFSGAYPEAFADYICGETLAQIGTVTDPIATAEVETDSETIRIAIAKAK